MQPGLGSPLVIDIYIFSVVTVAEAKPYRSSLIHTHTCMSVPASLYPPFSAGLQIYLGEQQTGQHKGKQRGAMHCLPVWFLFFLRLLPQRHCSICDPLLKMFQRNHIDLGEKQSSSLYTLRKKRSLRLHNNKLRPVLLKRGTSFIIEKAVIFRSSPSFFVGFYFVGFCGVVVFFFFLTWYISLRLFNGCFFFSQPGSMVIPLRSTLDYNQKREETHTHTKKKIPKKIKQPKIPFSERSQTKSTVAKSRPRPKPHRRHRQNAAEGSPERQP